MTRALILKELRQHWVTFLLLAGLLGAGLLLVTLAELALEQGSLLVALRDFLATFVVVALLVLCNRLVVLEYQGQTQLFLEALPLTRLRMVTVKFLLGLLLIGSLVGGALAMLLVACLDREVLTVRFVLIVAARSYAFLLCAYAFFFLMGLLGRYRIPLYLLWLAIFAFVSEATVLEPSRFGPFALLNDQFAFERHHFPTADLATTLGLAAGMIGAILVLALVREGSVATLLAEKMSHREKVFVALLLLCLPLGLSLYEAKAQRAPLDLPGAVEVSGGGVTVQVQGGAQTGAELAELLHAELAELKAYLQIDELPPVFVVLREDLDADRYERATVEGAAGVLSRANFLSGEFQERDFLAWLIRETLLSATQGRAGWEPRSWLLDGFAVFWSHRDRAAGPDGQQQRVELRAAYGAALGFSEQDVSHWLQYRHRVGRDIAAAVAWMGLEHLARAQGPEPCRDFLAELFRCDIPGDVRGWWHERRHPWQQLLAEHCGLSAEAFMAEWGDKLRAARRRAAREVAGIPRLQGTLVFEPLSPLTCRALWQIAAEPPPQDRVRLLYAELEAFQTEVTPAELRWEDLSDRGARQGELAETWSRGGRLFWTFAVRVEQLGCDVISGWQRQEIR